MDSHKKNKTVFFTSHLSPVSAARDEKGMATINIRQFLVTRLAGGGFRVRYDPSNVTRRGVGCWVLDRGGGGDGGGGGGGV